jgi:uncharacterized membrane protein
MAKNKSQKGNLFPDDKRAAKKAAVLGTEKKNPLPMIAVLGFIGLAIGIGLFLFKGTGKGPSTRVSTQQKTTVASNVTYPVELFRDGKARHFQYIAGNGMTIKYFILKSSDGVIRAAFDACDVCWPAAKGYYQDGDFMICRNCGRRFASVRVNEVRGGCNPAPLSREIVEGKLVIKVGDILEGKQYFDFSGRG